MNDLKSAHASDCKVCYGPHSDDIHDATVRIHRWLRQEVTRKLAGGGIPVPAVAEESPGLVA
jgi:hypothetical protein